MIHANLLTIAAQILILTHTFLVVGATPIGAQGRSEFGVEVTISTDSYLVSGANLREIAQQLNRRGPNGWWGRTSWQVYWNDQCRVRFEAEVLLPRIMGLSRLTPLERQRAEAMLIALESHEQEHVRMGLYAAEEVKRYDCKDPDKIIDYWKAKNDQFDLETLNGRTEGVELE